MANTYGEYMRLEDSVVETKGLLSNVVLNLVEDVPRKKTPSKRIN